jgi:hypothetical protein
MQTKSQILKSQIITKINYLEILKEEIAIMSEKHSKLLNKELDKKYGLKNGEKVRSKHDRKSN